MERKEVEEFFSSTPYPSSQEEGNTWGSTLICDKTMAIGKKMRTFALY